MIALKFENVVGVLVDKDSDKAVVIVDAENVDIQTETIKELSDDVILKLYKEWCVGGEKEIKAEPKKSTKKETKKAVSAGNAIYSDNELVKLIKKAKEKFTYREIAETLGVSETTIKRIISIKGYVKKVKPEIKEKIVANIGDLV